MVTASDIITRVHDDVTCMMIMAYDNVTGHSRVTPSTWLGVTLAGKAAEGITVQ